MIELDIQVFILAAGSAERWDGPVQKQLVDVGGQPLIGRMVEQVESIIGVGPWIVSNDREILFQSGRQFLPQNDDRLVDTLDSTTNEWADRTIILLGDVYYTDSVLTDILTSDVSLKFYGRLLEIYGLSFAYQDMMWDAINIVRQHSAVGKMWHIWYALNGYPQDEHTMPAHDNPFYSQVDPEDMTMDVDCLADYFKLAKKLELPVGEMI